MEIAVGIRQRRSVKRSTQAVGRKKYSDAGAFFAVAVQKGVVRVEIKGVPPVGRDPLKSAASVLRREGGRAEEGRVSREREGGVGPSEALRRRILRNDDVSSGEHMPIRSDPDR